MAGKRLSEEAKKTRHEIVRKHWPDVEKANQELKDHGQNIAESTLLQTAAQLKLKGATTIRRNNSEKKYHDLIKQHWPDTELIRQKCKEKGLKLSKSTIDSVAAKLHLKGAGGKLWELGYKKYESAIRQHGLDFAAIDAVKAELAKRGLHPSTETLIAATAQFLHKDLEKATDIFDKLEAGQELGRADLEHDEPLTIAACQHATDLNEQGREWSEIADKLKKHGLTDEQLSNVKKALELAKEND